MAYQQQLPVFGLGHMVLHCDLLEYLPPTDITRLLYVLKMSLKDADIDTSTQKGKWIMSIERELFVDPEIISKLHSEGYVICYIGEDLAELKEHIYDPDHTLTKQLRIWPCIFKTRDLTDREKDNIMHYGGPMELDYTCQSYNIVTNKIGSFDAKACYKDIGSKLHEVNCDMQSCNCEGIEWVSAHMCEHDRTSGWYGEITYESIWFKFESRSSDYMLLYYFIGYSEEYPKAAEVYTQGRNVYTQGRNVYSGDNALFGKPYSHLESETKFTPRRMLEAKYRAEAPTVLFNLYNNYKLDIQEAELCTSKTRHLCPDSCHKGKYITIFPYAAVSRDQKVQDYYHFNIDFSTVYPH